MKLLTSLILILLIGCQKQPNTEVKLQKNLSQKNKNLNQSQKQTKQNELNLRFYCIRGQKNSGISSFKGTSDGSNFATSFNLFLNDKIVYDLANLTITNSSDQSVQFMVEGSVHEIENEFELVAKTKILLVEANLLNRSAKTVVSFFVPKVEKTGASLLQKMGLKNGLYAVNPQNKAEFITGNSEGNWIFQRNNQIVAELPSANFYSPLFFQKDILFIKIEDSNPELVVSTNETLSEFKSIYQFPTNTHSIKLFPFSKVLITLERLENGTTRVLQLLPSFEVLMNIKDEVLNINEHNESLYFTVKKGHEFTVFNSTNSKAPLISFSSPNEIRKTFTDGNTLFALVQEDQKNQIKKLEAKTKQWTQVTRSECNDGWAY